MQDSKEIVIDYSVIHHANMLSDKNRLQAFKSAIQQSLTSNSVVVDIGTGTGILAAFAAEMTKKPVYAIEYHKFGANLASKLFKANALDNVLLLNQSSYDTTLPITPDILVTETIGQIGPEENIIEICFDFLKRYPSIHTIIPSKLSLYAEIIDSKNGNSKIERHVQDYLRASNAKFNYHFILEDLYKSFSDLILQADLQDAKSLSKPQLIVEYQLGKTESSSFNQTILIPRECQNKLIHLYFVAELGSNIFLSSRFTEETHWKHSFFPIYNGKSRVQVKYEAWKRFIQIAWLE